jgi:hypothetical protein
MSVSNNNFIMLDNESIFLESSDVAKQMETNEITYLIRLNLNHDFPVFLNIFGHRIQLLNCSNPFVGVFEATFEQNVKMRIETSRNKNYNISYTICEIINNTGNIVAQGIIPLDNINLIQSNRFMYNIYCLKQSILEYIRNMERIKKKSQKSLVYV